MKTFFAVFKPGVWALLWGAVMLMTAGCPLPIAYDYVIPLPKEADPVTPSSPSPSPSVSPSPSDQVPYVAEYNLQFYVPVPVAGKQPVKQAANRVGLDVQVVWKNAGGEDITESLAVFENSLEYQAEITLTAKNGYEFAGDIPFAYEEGMVREQTSDDNGHPTSRTVHAEYMAVTDFSPTPSSQKVDQTDLTSHIPAPAAGKAPVSFLLDPQYAGRVQWRADGIPAEGAFKPLTAYEAVVTLIAVSGYTFTGLPANAFSHTGALSVSSEADSGAVTISFEATGTIAVENYNLQDYVPVPAAGERAVKAVDRNDLGIKVVWKAGETDITNDLDRFALGVAYQAEITLEAKSGYAFDQPFAYPAGTISSLSGGSTDAGSRMLTVTYKQTQAPTTVTETNLTSYIPKPVTGGTPISYFMTSTFQYTGSVTWKKTADDSGHTGLFAADTAYSAVVSLHPASGYTLEGLNPNSFTRDEASVSYDPGARMVTIKFAETDKRPITGTFDLTPYLTAPVTGAMPATAPLYLPMAPFTGTVEWDTVGPFAADTAYTATVTLTPAPGYTIDGLTPVSFTHTGASSVNYTVGSNVVTVAFDAAAAMTAAAAAAAAAPRPVSLVDLTPYLAKPVSGGTPMPAIYTSQYAGPVSWTPADGLFVAGKTYTAVVELNAAAGYTFQGLPGPFTHSGGINSTPNFTIDPGDSTKGTVRIDFPATEAALLTPVTQTNLTNLLGTPVTGATGTGYFNAPQYSGTVAWTVTGGSAHTGPFAATTAYTATVSLNAAAGYTFQGLPGPFTHSDGINSTPNFTIDNNDSTKGTVRIDFPATEAALVTQTNLTGLLDTPVTGQPLKTTIYTDQYFGTVKWEYNQGGNNWLKEEGGFFAPKKKYRAKISLTLLPGYTLPDGNPFTHGSPQKQDIKVSGNTVTVEFKATGTALVTDYNLEHYVPRPAAGQIRVDSVARTDLTANIIWYVGSGTGSSMPTSTFAPDTVYTAVITLNCISGYEFNNSFTYTAGTVTSQAQDSSNNKSTTTHKVTVIYEKIDAYRVTILDLAPYLPPPAIGEVRNRNFTTSQYTGSVQWKQGTGAGQTFFTGPFFVPFGDASSGGYIAVITLRALPGYQFPSPASISDFTYTTPNSIVSTGGMPNPSTVGSGDTRTVTIQFLRDF